MVRRVVLGGGVPLVGPQEELGPQEERDPSGYTPRGFTSSPKQEAKYGFSGFITKNKQTIAQKGKSVNVCGGCNKQNKTKNASGWYGRLRGHILP